MSPKKQPSSRRLIRAALVKRHLRLMTSERQNETCVCEDVRPGTLPRMHLKLNPNYLRCWYEFLVIAEASITITFAHVRVSELNKPLTLELNLSVSFVLRRLCRRRIRDSSNHVTCWGEVCHWPSPGEKSLVFKSLESVGFLNVFKLLFDQG